MQENLNKYFTVKNIIFLLMVILCLVFISKVIDIALMFFAAFVFSATIKPLVDKLEKYMPRILAVCIVILLSLGIILGIFVPLIVLTIKQGVLLVDNMPSYLSKLKIFLSNFKIMGFSPSQYFDIDDLTNFGSGFLGGALKQSVSITKIIVSGFSAVIAVMIMIFYISYDKKSIKKVFISLFPQDLKERASKILDTITERVGGFLMAQILSMVFVGLITTIGLLILGHEHAFLLGFITFILDIIPVIGPVIATAIGLVTSAGGGFLYVVGVFIVYIVAQLLENQVLRPLIFGKFMAIHPLTIIISLLIGAKFLGIWGVILGPAIASMICVLIDELYVKEINSKTEETNDSKNG